MSSNRLEALARAKINLFLHVGARRTDGLHDLMSGVVFAAIGDKLTADRVPSEITLDVDGPYARATPLGTDNLVLQSAFALRAEAEGRRMINLGAQIRLTKSLPVAAGIGGGSADAAATMHLLNELWELGLPGGQLVEMGAALGSDVPVCVYNRSALVSGRGEMVKPGPEMPDIAIVLVNPGVEVPTAEVFGRLTRRTGASPPYIPDEIMDAAHLARVLEKTTNDLEEPALTIAPVIGDVLKVLRAIPGSLAARMSGSGATCFGVFVDHAAAQTAAVALKRARPNWWVAATTLDC